jgi:hypothetical protein
MAIHGTKIKEAGSGGMKNYFVNLCTIDTAEQIESQYTDASVKLTLVGNDNGYNYTCFINQNFEKDINGVVTGMKFPEDLNTLYLAAKADIDVSDAGVVNADILKGKEIAIINYMSTGKYKRNTWSVVSSWDDTENLENKFLQQVAKGYPRDFNSAKSTQSVTTTPVEETQKFDNTDLPF